MQVRKYEVGGNVSCMSLDEIGRANEDQTTWIYETGFGAWKKSGIAQTKLV